MQIPSTIHDLNSFRDWLDSDDVPEKLRIGYLDGEIWLDLSMEQIYTHVAVKGEFTAVLHTRRSAWFGAWMKWAIRNSRWK